VEYNDNHIDDAEFCLLYDLNRSDNLVFAHSQYEKFKLEDKDEAECISDFRVKKQDIPLLAEALGIPDTIRCNQGTICDGIEGLCIFLRRFAYPCRYSDLVPLFGRSVPELSMINNEVLEFIYETHGHLISRWNQRILSPDLLQIYADAVAHKEAPLQNCFGFVDGTVRPICRPIEHQRVVYNGHKRIHAIKFQSLALPNGLIGHIFGPVGKLFLFVKLVTKEYNTQIVN